MSKPQIWIPLFLVLPCFISSQQQQQDDFSFVGFSDGSNSNGNKISLGGSSEIEDTGGLRLTNFTSRLFGHAFYPIPLKFKDQNTSAARSFSTVFAFASVPEFATLGGHGFAFVVAPDKALPGAFPVQYLGILSPSDDGNLTNHLFAVEFDTVQDFEFGDINDNHVGIDLNSMTSKSSVPAAYFSENGTKTDLYLKGGATVVAWVDYDAAHNVINVSMSPTSTKPTKPILSYEVDLSPLLQDKMYVGFSASTGRLASSHYLFGWSFKMDGAARPLDLSSLPSLPHLKKKNTTFIFAATATSAALLIFAVAAAAAAAAYLFYRIKNHDPIEQWELDYGPHRFSYKELKRATKGFRDKELLGVGGFGKVYKGTLPGSHLEVAVKRVGHGSKQGLREFVAEIASIGRLRHRNLVRLQGWCRRRSDLLLVYDYMPNGSLDKFLFTEGCGEWPSPQVLSGFHHSGQQQQPSPSPERERPVLSWARRYHVLRGVASALFYLHEEWEHVVIHRDVKASNVLLDAELNGRLGDFGLAKLYEHGANPSTTRVVGTLGYLAPELTRTGKATTSSDAFAFGALALEVVCGRRPIEPKALPEQLILVDWVWEQWAEGRWDQVADPRLRGAYNRGEVEVAVKVGLMCSHPSVAARPTMREVLRYLEGGDAAEMPELRSPPRDYDGVNRVGFEDFVHSYPSSSFEKVSASELPFPAEECGPVGPRGDGQTQTSFAYSPLSLISRGSGGV